MIRQLPSFLEEKKSEIKEALVLENVLFAYLHGSVAMNQSTPLSDLDIAVFMDSTVEKSKYLDSQLRLLSECTRILKHNNIDLKILNNANTTFCFKVIDTGILIFCKNEIFRIKFEETVIRTYLDFQWINNTYDYYFAKKIEQGNIYD